MTCIITGCRLVSLDHQTERWGDLHRVGSTYVHNGRNCPVTGVTDQRLPTLTLRRGSEYLMMNDMTVVKDKDADLNDYAVNYIKTGRRS